jgi:hypothetical protein
VLPLDLPAWGVDGHDQVVAAADGTVGRLGKMQAGAVGAHARRCEVVGGFVLDGVFGGEQAHQVVHPVTGVPGGVGPCRLGELGVEEFLEVLLGLGDGGVEKGCADPSGGVGDVEVAEVA